MTVGIAGPMSLELIDIDWKGKKVPEGYPFPLTSYIINALLDKGVKVVAFTNSFDIEEPVVFHDEKITICVGRKSQRPGRSFFSLERKDLTQLMEKHAPDIINAQWSYEFAWAALKTGIPTIVTVRDHAPTIFWYFKDPYRLVRWIINNIVLRKSNHLITNSDYLKKLLKKRYSEKAAVVNNFYQPFLEDYFKADKKRSNAIVSVCNGFDERKNVKNGLKAFQLFRKQYPNHIYKLVGVGMEPGGAAHRYAKENNLTENVDFLGYISFDRVIDVISESDVLLHPSREESFGNTILEALVVGTNVVGGKNSGNVPYLLDHGKAGLLCDVNSPQSIADALTTFFSDEKLFDEYRVAGQRYAKENYSKNATIQKLIGIYEKVIS